MGYQKDGEWVEFRALYEGDNDLMEWKFLGGEWLPYAGSAPLTESMMTTVTKSFYYNKVWEGNGNECTYDGKEN